MTTVPERSAQPVRRTAMRMIPVAVALLLAAPACASRPAATPEPEEELDVEFVQGNGYNRSFYEDDGQTVFSFRFDVTNRGSDTGRSPNPRCQVMIDGELYDLEIFENPELAPGEKGFFRTGGVIPEVSRKEGDDLEAWCGL